MGAPAFVATALDPAEAKIYSADIAHDAVKHCFFAPWFDSKVEGQKKLLKAAMGSRDYGPLKGALWLHEDFKAKKGSTLTITHVPNPYGAPVFGDAILAGSGMSLQPDVLTLQFDVVGQGIENSGKYSDQVFMFNSLEEAVDGMGLWAGITTEEIITYLLWGIQTPANAVFKNLNNPAGYTSLLKNPVTPFDSSHLLFAGKATSTSTITSGDKLSAQMLSLIYTYATEDLDIPLRPFGDETFALISQRRGCEQIAYDPVWRYAMRANTNSGSNPMVKGQLGAEPYDGIRLFPFNRAPNPAANVGQSLLIGQDSFHMVKVQEWELDQVYTDVNKRRWIVAVDSMWGAMPHIINGMRQNSLAVQHYVRS